MIMKKRNRGDLSESEQEALESEVGGKNRKEPLLTGKENGEKVYLPSLSNHCLTWKTKWKSDKEEEEESDKDEEVEKT